MLDSHLVQKKLNLRWLMNLLVNRNNDLMMIIIIIIIIIIECRVSLH